MISALLDMVKLKSRVVFQQSARTHLLAAILVSICLFAQGSVHCREIVGTVSDNLSSELGFPVYTWSPADQSPRAVLVAIHGATLHGRSYTKIAEILSRKGYTLFAPDMRGFGAWYHNSDDNDKLSRHVLYRYSESDLQLLLKKVRQLYPGKPVFLMGESVGANMAIKLLAAEPKCADGMILSSPAIKQRLFFGPTVILQALTVFFVNPGAQLDVTPYLRSRVSEDERITQERIEDPLGRNRLNVGELFKTRWFNKECMKLAPFVPANVPVLVLEGSEDKLFHADDVNNMMSQLPCLDKKLHVLKGKGHIHLETAFVPEEVEAVLSDWLLEKSNKFARDNSKNQNTVSSLESAAAGKTP